MDWGFVNVEQDSGTTYRAACFAMICHHCGERYVEFFPNAKQENLFIGMIHAFQRMGVPEHVLTDNMKSVSTGRDSDGNPITKSDFHIATIAVPTLVPIYLLTLVIGDNVLFPFYKFNLILSQEIA